MSDIVSNQGATLPQASTGHASPLLIATVGLPRSGKSTLSKRLSALHQAPIVNKDNIRLALHGRVYVKEAEPMVRAIAKIMIEALFRSGHRVVIADETHYSRAARDFVADGPWITEFVVVGTPAETCIERAHLTNQPWLPPVIQEMATRYEPLGAEERRYAMVE